MASISSASTFTVGTPSTVKKKPTEKSKLAAKPQDPRGRCCYGGSAFFNALKAMTTRLVFLLHAIVVTWRASLVHSERIWYLGVAYASLVLETIIVLAVRKGQEWKWFSPCVFLYLTATIPGIWILEEASVAQRLGIGGNNTSGAVLVGSLYINLTLDQWSWALSQSMLVLIIVGRWMLPKGDLSRDQLSGLLLSYVGIASDIIDFFNILEEDDRLSSGGFFYVVTSVWAWSLLQFAFVRTATKDNQHEEEEENSEEANVIKVQKDNLFKKETKIVSERRRAFTRFVRNSKARLKLALETEVWAIVLGLSMQDGPFFIVRLISIFEYNVISDSNLFFVAKNFLVLVLQIYRLVALHREHSQMKREQKEKRRKEVLKTMYRNAFLVGKLGTSRSLVSPASVGHDYADLTS